MTFKPHRQAIVEMLTRKEVSLTLTPNKLVARITILEHSLVITFRDKDLPKKGFDHSNPLNMIVET